MKDLRPEMVDRVVERFRALADANRIRLLMCLREGPCNVNSLTGRLGVSQASVSKHLAVLKQVGLVEVERRGTQGIYRVRDESIFDLCEIVCDGVLRHARQEQAALGLTEAPGSRVDRAGAVDVKGA